MNALSNPLKLTDALRAEDAALAKAPTLFNSREVLSALERKLGAAAAHCNAESVWNILDEDRQRAQANTPQAMDAPLNSAPSGGSLLVEELRHCRDCDRERVPPYAPLHQATRGNVVECDCGELLVALNSEVRTMKAAFATAVARHLI